MHIPSLDSLVVVATKTKPAIALVAAACMVGCTPAVQVIQPGDSVHAPVTALAVRFHEYYEPGTFRAYLDGQDITASFSPAGVAGGTAASSWSQPYTGGQPVIGGVYVGVPQAAGQSLGTLPSGQYTHSLRTTGSCKAGTVCATSDEQPFVPITFIVSPAPLQFPVGTALYAQLRADRSLSAPLAVTVEPRRLSPPTAPALHVSVNGNAPGAPATIVLPAGTGAVTFYVTGQSPGGYYLLLSAPGTQRGSVTGSVK
jgi:hypothetical protein